MDDKGGAGVGVNYLITSVTNTWRWAVNIFTVAAWLLLMTGIWRRRRCFSLLGRDEDDESLFGDDDVKLNL